MPRHPDRAEPVVSSVIIVLDDFDRVCEALSLRDTPALLAFPVFYPCAVIDRIHFGSCIDFWGALGRLLVRPSH